MSSETYRILFSGKTLGNTSAETAKYNLQQLLKASPDTIDRLFSGKTVVIKKDLDASQVQQYVAALNKAGVDVAVDPPLAETGMTLELEEVEPKADSTATQAHTGTARESIGSAEVANPYSAPTAQGDTPKVHCRQCGAKIDATDTSCFNCGAKQELGKSRSKVTAGVLAILFGWLGVHRFYLGQWWGIVYLLLGVLAWPVAIIEGLVFFFTPQSGWQARYGNVKSLHPALMVLVAVLFLIPIIGILAAVAIPAYQDYTLRAQVQSTFPVVKEYREQVSDFILRTNFMPNSNLDAGLPERISEGHIRSLQIRDGGRMEVTFSSQNDSLNGETIVWAPDVAAGNVTWDCSGGTLSKKYRPQECREGQFAGEQPSGPTKTFNSNDGRLQVRTPTSWSTLDLNEEASIQAGNMYAEVYLVVIAESKADLTGVSLRDYANFVLEHHAEGSTESDIQHIGTEPVNGMEAIHYRVDSEVDNLDVNYLYAIVEGKNNFYQLITWSLASRFSGNKDDMQKVIHSFTER